jgi:hypothetical protein
MFQISIYYIHKTFDTLHHKRFAYCVKQDASRKHDTAVSGHAHRALPQPLPRHVTEVAFL